MIRKLVDRYFTEDRKYAEIFGMSSDDKPVEGLVTGSKFTEVDTGIVYLFDEVSQEWFAQGTGNGKTSIAGATVTLGSSPAYNGTQKTQTVSSVKIGATTLVADTDYKIKNNTATDVGSYVLQIVGIGSYTGAISEGWQIVKGSGSVTASPDSLSLTEGGDAGTSALTVVGDGEVSVSTSAKAVATASVEGTTVTVVPVAEGSATITVTLADGEKYEGGTDTISVTVEAASDDT
ncbi:MAG: hypothetical protein IIZ93_01490 [Acidaminococcaceae bacterium]|nr:hypothetical protein [Acidaminococcaceae bacterium]